MNQKNTPLFDAIINFANNQSPTPFFIPGHKMGHGINPKWKDFTSDNIFKMDLTEVTDLDDFHCPQGVIKESQLLAADAWGAKKSYFLVNGTSGGIIASILSTVQEGEKIIVPRNSHKSVSAALIMSGAVPVYVLPEYNSDLGLVCGMNPDALEEACMKNNDIKAVFGVSPTYHGICSDVKMLADITHKNNGIYIADEAHASHVYFSEKLPKGALMEGSDISCQSTHKMAGSLTQSSILHVNGDRIDIDFLEANLGLIQSTSPSYILMASLDLARSYIATEGNRIFDELYDIAKSARQEMSEIQGLRVLDSSLINQFSIYDYEPMRFVISAIDIGLDGYTLRKILFKEYNVEVEFSDDSYIICLLGIGSSKDDIERLLFALKAVSKKYSKKSELQEKDNRNINLPDLPQMYLTPREAWNSKKKKVLWENALGLICAETIVSYPPGVPVIYPGEKITKDIWEYLEGQRINGRHLHCSDEGKLEYINVID